MSDFFTTAVLDIEATVRYFLTKVGIIQAPIVPHLEDTLIPYTSLTLPSEYQALTAPSLTSGNTGFSNVSQDVDILARTLWGEARGEGSTGMQAVANVIINRVDDGRFGDGIIGVCQKPYQFSSWNANDPNRARLLSVTAADPQFSQALQIAQYAASGQLQDLTGGALYYYATSISEPAWAADLPVTAQIGQHIFMVDA